MPETTVYLVAVFDQQTQRLFAETRSTLANSGLATTQIYKYGHVSIGTFKKSAVGKLKTKTDCYAKHTAPFKIAFDEIGTFGQNVIFAKPTVNAPLRHLRGKFKSDFNFSYEWEPHATMFMAENADAFITAHKIISQTFKPLTATVSELHLVSECDGKINIIHKVKLQ